MEIKAEHLFLLTFPSSFSEVSIKTMGFQPIANLSSSPAQAFLTGVTSVESGMIVPALPSAQAWGRRLVPVFLYPSCCFDDEVRLRTSL